VKKVTLVRKVKGVTKVIREPKGIRVIKVSLEKKVKPVILVLWEKRATRVTLV